MYIWANKFFVNVYRLTKDSTHTRCNKERLQKERCKKKTQQRKMQLTMQMTLQSVFLPAGGHFETILGKVHTIMFFFQINFGV